MRVAAVLDGRGAQAPDDRRRTGGEETREVAEEGPARRRVAAGGEGDGDTGELVVAKDAVDRPAVAMHDRDGGAVVAEGNATPVAGAIRTHGHPAGVIEEGVRDDASGLVVLARLELSRSVRMRTYVRVVKFHPRRQGDVGEISAMEWFESKGAGIYFPIGHSPHCDFIAEFADGLVRVQGQELHMLPLRALGGDDLHPWGQPEAESSNASIPPSATASSSLSAMAAAGASPRRRYSGVVA